MNGELMTRQGLPTGQMEQETQELLDEYNEEYCWEYNDMVDFIKEHGEKDFREYYESYKMLCEDYDKELVDAYIEIYNTNGIDYFEESYQGQLTGAEFAEETCTDCGYISKDMPSWIHIDWQKTWDNSLSYDYTEIDGHIFNNNY